MFHRHGEGQFYVELEKAVKYVQAKSNDIESAIGRHRLVNTSFKGGFAETCQVKMEKITEQM